MFGNPFSPVTVDPAWLTPNVTALAATAYHALSAPGAANPERIVGHGVLGRLLARVSIATGGEPPIVLERNPKRTTGARGYSVLDPYGFVFYTWGVRRELPMA